MTEFEEFVPEFEESTYALPFTIILRGMTRVPDTWLLMFTLNEHTSSPLQMMIALELNGNECTAKPSRGIFKQGDKYSRGFLLYSILSPLHSFSLVSKTTAEIVRFAGRGSLTDGYLEWSCE